MMSLAHRYGEFRSEFHDIAASETKLSEESTDASLEAFENGYQAGWQDAATALEIEKQKMSVEFLQRLNDISFTYQEARSKVLLSMKPLLAAITKKLFSDTLQTSLATHLIEKTHELLKLYGENTIEFSVSPGNVDIIQKLLSQQSTGEFSVVTQSDLTDSQVLLKVCNSESWIDLDHLEQSVSGLLNEFFEENLEVSKSA